MSAVLNDSKSIDYAGREINNRFYAGIIFLYNSELSMGRVSNFQLDRMNATVAATSENETMVSADFMPAKSLDYEIVTYIAKNYS